MHINSIRCIVLLIILREATAHGNQTRKRNFTNYTIKHGQNNNSKPIRRINEDPLEKLQKELGKFAHHGKIETYYDPYWQSGEWVFLRITTRKGDTPPATTTLIPGITAKKFRKWPMSIYRDCDLLCINIYKDNYGAVCAQRYNTMTWKNEYKSFKNMCELERENCKLPEKRPSE
ncbi:hypothetical protein O3G_MSEX003069 [Manduca sexta]|uniref:Salivary lipocalin n=1 Tax=Manduca sexta TaxID=7130 RepID=A0A921YRR2_MANSE|nr:hypothetical protein O3G_MSEX003069 [Manduca sexta]